MDPTTPSDLSSSSEDNKKNAPTMDSRPTAILEPLQQLRDVVVDAIYRNASLAERHF
jgi:hypothetical protein